ncbi:unnamed protein product [Protopolystoma xenopodis]|uniref:Uncharacterized protein n=1 Tax=Protopolystoma xenopodis TaxID=117903 RepID=A0A448X4M0_9PLAT|nr:unnamed protein product [Protopolystoma xenopodis]
MPQALGSNSASCVMPARTMFSSNSLAMSSSATTTVRDCIILLANSPIPSELAPVRETFSSPTPPPSANSQASLPPPLPPKASTFSGLSSPVVTVLPRLTALVSQTTHPIHLSSKEDIPNAVAETGAVTSSSLLRGFHIAESFGMPPPLPPRRRVQP